MVHFCTDLFVHSCSKVCKITLSNHATAYLHDAKVPQVGYSIAGLKLADSFARLSSIYSSAMTTSFTSSAASADCGAWSSLTGSEGAAALVTSASSASASC